MSDFIFGAHSLGENNEKAPRKKDMPWIRDPEDFKYKWYVDTTDECAECGYDDTPCLIFGEGDFFCSEKCMWIFYEEYRKMEEELEEEMRKDEEECGPWWPVDDCDCEDCQDFKDV